MAVVVPLLLLPLLLPPPVPGERLKSSEKRWPGLNEARRPGEGGGEFSWDMTVVMVMVMVMMIIQMKSLLRPLENRRHQAR